MAVKEVTSGVSSRITGGLSCGDYFVTDASLPEWFNRLEFGASHIHYMSYFYRKIVILLQYVYECMSLNSNQTVDRIWCLAMLFVIGGMRAVFTRI